MSTLVVEIEGLINSRPLTYVFDDDEPNATPLCPSHLIYGRRITSMPNSQHYEVVSTYQSLRKRARHHRNLIQQFTKQWRTEYLLGLREHSRAMARNSKTGNISIGDVVILRNDKTSRCFWKLAKVEQLLHGEDNLVRAAVVKVLGGKNDKSQLLRRSISHLIPIEVTQIPNGVKNGSGVAISELPVAINTRPRRKAAVIGELKRAKQLKDI